jgi:hypothetical protein
VRRTDGRDAWVGAYADPIHFYEVRRRRIGRPMRWLGDPVRGMYVALAEWAGEPLPTTKTGWREREGGKHTARRYRRDRLAGLLGLDRELTAAEEYEVAQLIEALRADRRRKAAKKSNNVTTKKGSTP